MRSSFFNLLVTGSTNQILIDSIHGNDLFPPADDSSAYYASGSVHLPFLWLVVGVEFATGLT